MNRREMLRSSLAGGVGLALAGAAVGKAVAQVTPAGGEASAAKPAGAGGAKFQLKYAPHLGQFENLAGKDALDQLRFMADQGFTAFECNGLARMPVEEQERIGKELARLGMTMGVFVAHGKFGEKTFVCNDGEIRKGLVAEMKAAVEVARRVDAKWCTVVPDAIDPKLDMAYQTANVIDNLRACCEVLEPAGLVMVLEPLNRYNHPGLFLTGVPQAYAICRAVDSPSCKILDDLYHQQVTEGNLIPNLEMAWSEIAYIQLGDNPGRNEPGTGEINYRNIFRWLRDRGWQGVLGMEHGTAGKGREGELAVLEAYRQVDRF